MTTIHFHGHSDDVISISGDAVGCDDYYADRDDSGTFLVKLPNCDEFAVVAKYTEHGTWAFTPMLLGEAPDFDVEIDCHIGTSGNDYSLDLMLMVPEGTTVERLEQ